MNSDKFLEKLLPGDILVMTSVKFDPTGILIRWWTQERFSHTALYIGDGNIIEAIYTGVHQINWSKTLYPSDYRVIALRPKTSQENCQKAIEFAKKQLNSFYDYPMLVFLFVSTFLMRFGINIRGFQNWFDIKQWYYCSELNVDAYWETSQTRLIKEDINRGQVIPDDFIDRGVNLEKIAEYTPDVR